MRRDIVHAGADELKYEIRQIVALAKKIQALGTPITWENIGDPIAKGETVPEWIKEIVQKHAKITKTYGYSPTMGLQETRDYIANERNLEGGIQIRAEDILFFNGLGDSITNIYSNLNPNARVIGPNPAYPTHSSAEAAHAGSAHITYKLDPTKGWQPDLVELQEKIAANPDIVGILIINPDNPTGFVYPKRTLEKIVDIARRYKLMVISDEIYSNLAYEGSGMQKLASVISDVPGIAMRGISKEFPWPGARCGWVEFYNRGTDENFNRYTQSIIEAKMLEVCSTTLPQAVLPEVMSDSRYYPYLATRTAAYAARSAEACEVLSVIPELHLHPAQGAFYMTAYFSEGALKNTQSSQLSPEAESILKPHLEQASLDQRFAYYLLAATGICVVPLSTGFNASLYGFRFTLLESDEEKFHNTLTQIEAFTQTYLRS